MGIAALALPVLAAAALWLLAGPRAVWRRPAALAGSGLGLVASLALVLAPTLAGWPVPDAAGRLALPAAAAGVLAGLVARTGLPRGLMTAMLSLQAALTWCALRPDLAGFAAGLAASGVCVLFLVGRWGNAEARTVQAIRACILLVVAAGALLASGPDGRGLPAWALAAALAIPSAIFPFHWWLLGPVGTAGPTVAVPVAVGVLGVGGLGWLRYGGPLLGAPGWREALALLGAAQLLYGALCALAQRDLRQVLAYAAVSHGGLVLVALGGGAPDGVAAAAAMPILRGAWIGLALLAAGVLLERAGHMDLDRLGGVGIQLPRFSLVALPGFLAAMGIPGTCAFPVLRASLEDGALAGGEIGLVAAGLAVSAGYAVRCLASVFLGRPGDACRRFADLTGREFALLGIFAAVVVLLGLVSGPLLERGREAAAFLAHGP